MGESEERPGGMAGGWRYPVRREGQRNDWIECDQSWPNFFRLPVCRRSTCRSSVRAEDHAFPALRILKDAVNRSKMHPIPVIRTEERASGPWQA